MGALGSALLLELPALSGCAPASKDPPGTRYVPLSALKSGARTVVFVGGLAVELTRGDTGVTARSLLCTHWGCTVRWDEATQRYKCPCHHGEYDADGKVLSGPPPRPLAPFPVEIAADTVILRPVTVTR